MKRLITARSFDRDMSKLRMTSKIFNKLTTIIERLQKAEQLPPNARPHKLSGEWDGAWECHIAPDWLLIYHYTPHTLTLLRTGNHQELFD